MTENDWIKVFTSSQYHLIEMAKQVLEANGFETQILNQKDSSYLFGYMYLFVKKENEEACRLLISQFKTDLGIE